MNPIPHSKPWITDADMSAVREVLASGMLAQGEKTRQVERVFAGWIGGAGSVAVGSGSAALALAMMALEVGPGDEIILPSYVCTSVLEAVLTVGATPVLCDVGPDWLLTDENVDGCVTSHTKAIIVPHMYGRFAEIASFTRFGLPIIEDCAQAVDGKGKRSLRSTIAIFSLHPTKCLTSGEGGVAVSGDADLVGAMRSIRDGVEHADKGRLFSPLSDLSAALALSQLSRFDEMLDRRRALGERYRSALQHIFHDGVDCQSMYYRFPLKVPGGWEAYQEPFLKKGVHIRRGVDKLVHRFRGEADRNFKNATRLFDSTVLLPIYPAMTDAEHAVCVNAAMEIFSSAGNRICRQ